jgi:hypothetical protein
MCDAKCNALFCFIVFVFCNIIFVLNDHSRNSLTHSQRY